MPYPIIQISRSVWPIKNLQNLRFSFLQIMFIRVNNNFSLEQLDFQQSLISVYATWDPFPFLYFFFRQKRPVFFARPYPSISLFFHLHRNAYTCGVWCVIVGICVLALFVLEIIACFIFAKNPQGGVQFSIGWPRKPKRKQTFIINGVGLLKHLPHL